MDFGTINEKSNSTLTERIQYEIEALILSGTLPPGEHIKEQALATLLGTSRGPVREACRSLERAGLVRIIPNRGVFVRRITLKEVLDIFDIRAQLAHLAGREAAHNISPRKFAELHVLVENMDEAARNQDADAYLELNLSFHEVLYSLCENEKLRQLERELGNSIALYRRRGLASGGGLESSNREHRALTTALAQGKPEDVADLFRDHVLNGKARFAQAMAHAPEPFA